MKRRKGGSRSWTFALSMLLVTNLSFGQIGRVVGSFPGPYEHPSGLAFDGQDLWVADLAADRIYRIDRSTGQVLGSFPSPGGAPTGLAWDGTHLWCSDNELDAIFKLDPADGRILDTLRISTTAPRGLTFKDGKLYYQDSGARKIFCWDPDSGKFVDEFTSPSGYNRGLTWDGRYFWSVDRKLNEFYQIDPVHKKVVTILRAPGSYSYGLAWDGQYLWNADYDGNRIYKISLSGDELYARYDSLEYTVRYTVVTRNSSSSRMYLRSYFAVPSDGLFQTLLSDVRFSRPPKEMVVDSYGQTVAVYVDTLQGGATVTLQWQVNARSYTGRFLFLPDRVGDANEIPPEILDVYTRDGQRYQIHDPVIQDAVREALGDETNYYWKVRRLHDYVISHIEYERDNRWAPAPECLQTGKGSCSEYTFTFVALCRAAGIPARYEAGGHIRSDLPYEDTVFHRWAQVYFPRVGWVPIDPTWDDKSYPANQARYFGGYSRSAFATTRGGGGSEYLGWSYNVRQSSSGGARSSSKKFQFLPMVSGVAVVEGDPELPTTLQLQAFPNPFRDELTIWVRSGRSADLRVTVFDLLGRMVRRLWPAPTVDADGRFSWDGRAENGSALASGVFIIVAEDGAERVVRRVTLLR